MHGHSNWINLVLSAAMFVVTGVLAWATWKYMRFTKRMADSMDQQAKIMSREFELKVSPLINIIQQTSTTSPEKGTYPYIIENLGMFPVTLIDVSISLWYPSKDKIVPVIVQKHNYEIAPKGSKEVVVVLDFAQIDKVLLDNQVKQKAFMQPVFGIIDSKSELKPFSGPKRTIW